jgi:hypothetical protein
MNEKRVSKESLIRSMKELMILKGIDAFVQGFFIYLIELLV